MAYEHSLQLTDLATGRNIMQAGVAVVVQKGTPTKLTLTDLTGASKDNEFDFTDGKIEFRVDEAYGEVDIYGVTEKGYAFQVLNAVAGATSELFIDLGRLAQDIILPFDIADSDITANTEKVTKFYFADDVAVLPEGLGVIVETADSGITVDLGTDSTSGTNDPDGLLDGVSVAALGPKFGEIGHTVGTNNVIIDVTGGDVEWTYGVLMSPSGTKVAAKADGGDAAGTNGNGLAILTPHIADNSVAANREYISFTLAASADTAAGFFVIPTRLPTVSAPA